VQVLRVSIQKSELTAWQNRPAGRAIRTCVTPLSGGLDEDA